MIRNLVLGSALVLAAACGKGGDDAFMEKTIGVMEGMAKAVTSAGDDCGKMAANLEEFVKKNEGAMKELKAKSEEMKKDEGKSKAMAKSAEKYKDRMEKVMPAMMGMMKCSDDPKFKAIEEKIKDFM